MERQEAQVIQYLEVNLLGEQSRVEKDGWKIWRDNQRTFGKS